MIAQIVSDNLEKSWVGVLNARRTTETAPFRIFLPLPVAPMMPVGVLGLPNPAGPFIGYLGDGPAPGPICTGQCQEGTEPDPLDGRSNGVNKQDGDGDPSDHGRLLSVV